MSRAGHVRRLILVEDVECAVEPGEAITQLLLADDERRRAVQQWRARSAGGERRRRSRYKPGRSKRARHSGGTWAVYGDGLPPSTL